MCKSPRGVGKGEGEGGGGRGEGGGALRYISDGKVQNPFLVLKFAIWTFCGD